MTIVWPVTSPLYSCVPVMPIQMGPIWNEVPVKERATPFLMEPSFLLRTTREPSVHSHVATAAGPKCDHTDDSLELGSYILNY